MCLFPAKQRMCVQNFFSCSSLLKLFSLLFVASISHNHKSPYRVERPPPTGGSPVSAWDATRPVCRKLTTTHFFFFFSLFLSVGDCGADAWIDVHNRIGVLKFISASLLTNPHDESLKQWEKGCIGEQAQSGNISSASVSERQCVSSGGCCYQVTRFIGLVWVWVLFWSELIPFNNSNVLVKKYLRTKPSVSSNKQRI